MSKSMPDTTINLEPLPPLEAIKAFRHKVLLSAKDFYALEESVRARAFTVARVSKMDILNDIFQAVDEAIAKGETLADFRARLGEIMQTKGWSGTSPWHEENIFRTNIQTAYSVGREQQAEGMQDSFPAAEYDAVNDDRVRPEHAAMDGKVFPVNHPFWNTWTPPNGYQCRCSKRYIHKYELEAMGIKMESIDPTGAIVSVENPRTGEIKLIQLRPDKGFGTNPAKAKWQPDLSKYPQELRRQYEQEAA